jgi:hypothetical protein
MTYVCMYCREELGRDDRVPSDPRFMVSHTVCDRCQKLSSEELIVVTRRAWEVALVAALIAGDELPHKPEMVRHLDLFAAQ